MVTGGTKGAGKLLFEGDQMSPGENQIYDEIVKLAPAFPDLQRVDEIWFVNTSIPEKTEKTGNGMDGLERNFTRPRQRRHIHKSGIWNESDEELDQSPMPDAMPGPLHRGAATGCYT